MSPWLIGSLDSSAYVCFYFSTYHLLLKLSSLSRHQSVESGGLESLCLQFKYNEKHMEFQPYPRIQCAETYKLVLIEAVGNFWSFIFSYNSSVIAKAYTFCFIFINLCLCLFIYILDHNSCWQIMSFPIIIFCSYCLHA